METFGARCIASPSIETSFGRQVLAATPDSNGSLGIAISEAVEVAGRRRRHQLRARFGAESRAAAPDRHRPGSARPDGARQRLPDIVVGSTGAESIEHHEKLLETNLSYVAS
jgi:hypothetical protein